MYFLYGLAIIILLALITLVGIASYYNMQSDRMPQNAEFAANTVPAQLPNGKYNGVASVSMGTWRGKVFDSIKKTGANWFADGSERYPFEMSVAGSIRDGNKQVVQINYNIPKNPLWLRLVTDEIVEVGPNKFLGKIQIRILPGLPFTAGYFTLEK